MALPSNSIDRENQKFVEDADGNVAVRTQMSSGDIEIGAVEIKDHDSATRANVGANGLEVDIRASELPSGAATSAKQLADGHNVTVDNASLPVTGTFWQATQSVALEPVGTPTTTNLTLTTANTDYKLPASELASRKTLVVSNNDDTTVYIGQTSVIDADATPPIGIPLEAGKTIMFDNSTGIYAQCASAGKKLTITEMA